MKISEIYSLKNHITKKDLSNLFHIKDIDNTGLVYSIMRTLHFDHLNDVPLDYFNYYTAIVNDTWPLISFKLYDTTELWWMLIKLNEIKNPFVEPLVGYKIRYISKATISDVLNTIRDK